MEFVVHVNVVSVLKVLFRLVLHLPAVFGFLIVCGKEEEEARCIPAVTTFEVGAMVAGVAAMAMVVFFTVFWGGSDDSGTLLSS